MYNWIREKYYALFSIINKYLFKLGKRKTYQYMDELFCADKKVFDEIKNKYYRSDDGYWNSQQTYSVNSYFSKTYENAKRLIFEDFLTKFENKPVLLDIGCAGGDWTMMVSPKCEEVDGYEYSQSMVDTANKKIKDEQIENVHFYQADAQTLRLNKKYDAAMILGVLMYFDDKEIIYKILKNVYDYLKPGAYLCTRDTINDENRELILMYNILSGYSGFYWCKETYYEQFKRVGFVLKKEVVLEKISSRRLSFIHIGNIWQKPE